MWWDPNAGPRTKEEVWAEKPSMTRLKNFTYILTKESILAKGFTLTKAKLNLAGVEWLNKNKIDLD